MIVTSGESEVKTKTAVGIGRFLTQKLVRVKKFEKLIRHGVHGASYMTLKNDKTSNTFLTDIYTRRSDAYFRFVVDAASFLTPLRYDSEDSCLGNDCVALFFHFPRQFISSVIASSSLSDMRSLSVSSSCCSCGYTSCALSASSGRTVARSPPLISSHHTAIPERRKLATTFFGVEATCHAESIRINWFDWADFSESGRTLGRACFVIPNNPKSSACVLSEE
jgi:hypothetical protein